MAEEEKKSGCGLMVLYNGIFRRRNSAAEADAQPGPPRRSSSAGSIPASPSSSSTNSKRRRAGSSDDSALVVPDPCAGARSNHLPVVPAKQMIIPKAQIPNNQRHQRPTAGGQRKTGPPPHGISGELDAVIYDHQRAKGASTLVRASSSNVMLFGDLGNLRAGGGGGGGGGGRRADVLDCLPKTAKELKQGNAGRPANRRESPAPVPAEPAAAGSLCRAISKRLDPEELKEMGNEEYKNGRFAEALALYDRAIAMDPERASYWSNKAAALTGLGRFLEAVAECKEAVRIEPSYKRAHHRLATLYLRLGEAEKATHHYKLSGSEAGPKDMTKAQNLQNHMSKFNEARKMKDWNTLLKEAEAAVTSGADSAPQVFAAQMEALLKLQRHQEADMVLIDSPTFEMNEATKFFGAVSNAYVLCVRAQIDMAAGRFDEAVSLSQKASKMDPGSKEVAAVLRRTRAVASARSKGNDLFKAGKHAEACTAYGEGLEHDSHNSVLLCNRAACRIKLNQLEKAVEDCDKALRVRPSYNKARLRRADCNEKLEKWEECLQDYKLLLKEMPGDEEVQKALSEIQNKLNRHGGEDAKNTGHENSIEKITTDNQFKCAIESSGGCVVLFYDKSSKSQEMISYMVKLSQRYQSVNFAKVDKEENPNLAKSERVTSIPIFMMYKDGSRFKEITGSDIHLLDSIIKNLSP